MNKYILTGFLLLASNCWAANQCASPLMLHTDDPTAQREFQNLYQCATYPNISTGTAQNFTIVNTSITTLNLTGSATGFSPVYQVVISTCGDDTSSTSATFANFGLQAIITTKSTHKVRIRSELHFASNAGGLAGSIDEGIRIQRNGSTIKTFPDIIGFGFTGVPSSNYGYRGNGFVEYVDTGVTTAGTYTYVLQMNNANAVGTVYTYCANGATCYLYLEEVN